MNIVIFGGFLGSGKTSLIISLANFLVKRSAPEIQKLMIIENEIGETGIDDKVLKAGGFSVKDIVSGCICCTLSTDLIMTLNDISQSPDLKWVIIESTGLAYPGKVQAMINKYGKGYESIRILTVVDAERWDELTTVTPDLVENQVKDADTVLINKIDLVDKAELHHVEVSTHSINPKAVIYRLSANNGVDDSTWKEVMGIHE